MMLKLLPNLTAPEHSDIAYLLLCTENTIGKKSSDARDGLVCRLTVVEAIKSHLD